MERTLRCIGKSPVSHKACSQEPQEEALWGWAVAAQLLFDQRVFWLPASISWSSFLLDSPSLCCCLALTDLCCLGSHMRSKFASGWHCLVWCKSRSKSWSTAWSYCSCSYISKLIVNMKLGITAQNLWLTCRISQEASVAHWQQASQRSHPGKDSSLLRALLPFPIHDTCFTYIRAPQCCPLTKLRYTGSPAQPEDHWCVWSHPGLQPLKYQL